MHEVRKVVEEEREIPQIGEEEVLIQVMDCGICGSDIHYYEYGRIGDFIVENPMILGHECAGRIIKKGKSVDDFQIGDLVAVEPGYTCGKCEFCKTGRYNLCKDVIFLATPPYDGAFVEYLKYPANMVFKLPETMDTIEGALLEPFCVGLHAVQQSGIQAGDSAAILGAGCIGLCTLMALNAIGVKNVYVTDVMNNRLNMAAQVGDVNLIYASKENVVDKIMQLTKYEGVDVVFETAGNKITTQQTAEIVKKGGVVTLVGMAPNPIFEYNFGTLQNKEATIKTVFRYRNLYPKAIRLVSENKIPLKKIVTNVYQFSEISTALERSVLDKKTCVKSIVHVSD